jgi:hypothetical protein
MLGKGTRTLARRQPTRMADPEPALSAWEPDRLGPLTALTWTSDAPLVTVMDSSIPGLLARNGP